MTSDYFRTMAVPLVSGRLIGASDGTIAPPVLLVNEAAAQRFFGEQDPLGKQIRFWGASRTIVGVVGNERFHGLAEAPPPAVYSPLDQTPSVERLGSAAGANGRRSRRARHPRSEARSTLRIRDWRSSGSSRSTETVARTIAERRFTMLVLGSLLASRCCSPRRVSTGS